MSRFKLFSLLLLALALPVFAADEMPDDVQLANRISAAFASNDAYKDALVQVHSLRGFILLTGQVSSEEARSQATNTVVFASSAIRRIINELQVVSAIDTSTAESDSNLQTTVVTELAAMDAALAQRVEVVVHRAVVYLLGALTSEEQSTVANKVSTLAGVASIKTAFEAVQTAP